MFVDLLDVDCAPDQYGKDEVMGVIDHFSLFECRSGGRWRVCNSVMNGITFYSVVQIRLLDEGSR